MDKLLKILEAFLNAVEATKDAFVQNWRSFLIIIIYTGVVVLLCRGYYKHKQETLEYREEALELRLHEIERKEAEMDKKQQEHERMKAEIESPEYQAYLMSHKIYRRDLDDSNMFR